MSLLGGGVPHHPGMKGHKLRGENIAFFYMSILLDALLTIEPSSLDCPEKIAVDSPAISPDLPVVFPSPALNASLSNNNDKEGKKIGNNSTNSSDSGSGSDSDKQNSTTSTSTSASASSLIFINGTTSNTTSNSTPVVPSSSQSKRGVRERTDENIIVDLISQSGNMTQQNSNNSSRVKRDRKSTRLNSSHRR